MPLVSFEEVKLHIAGSAVRVLEEPGIFTAIEAEASKLVRDRTGLAIPETVNGREASSDWVILPMAWIIQYIAFNQVASKSPELGQRVREQYNDAKDILADHPFQAATVAGTVALATFGDIEGMYE